MMMSIQQAMNHQAHALLALFFMLAAPVHAQRAPYPDGLYGEVYTPRGVIVIQLAFERTPMTVANFVGLAEGTIRNAAFPDGRPFFDGSTFHRVVPGHVIQGGIPASDAAESSGNTLPNEIDTTMSHDHAGAVGMASAGPHTATNQFYITLGDRSYLDRDYALFGEVVRGMEAVDAIERDDRIDSVRIVRVGRAADGFRPTTESFLGLKTAVQQRVAGNEARMREAERDFVRANWPNAIPGDSEVQYVVVREGAGPLPRSGDTLRVRYIGRTVPGLGFASAGDGGEPGWPSPDAVAGRVFTYVVGTTSVTPGLDAAIAQMRPGETRAVIVPASMGYGTRSGYYAPPHPSQPRFVISPNTMLIYTVTVVRPNGRP